VAARAGLRRQQVWLDDDRLFSVQSFLVAPGERGA
jgi:hypothetical protein